MMEPQTETYAVTGQDLFNYSSAYLGCNHQINAVLTFSERISLILLQQALLLLLQQEPLLKCRLVIRNDAATWVRRHDLSLDQLCTSEKTASSQDGIAEFINKTVDTYYDPLLQLKLLQGPDHDRLCIKINHACGDAGALKECIRTLSSLYTELQQNQGEEKAKLAMRTQRGVKQILQQFSLSDLKKAWLSPTAPFSNSSIPPTSNQNHQANYHLEQIEPEQFLTLKRFAKNFHATINDCLLAASFRVLFRCARPLPHEQFAIYVTTDLRKYIPTGKSEALANLSGLFEPTLSYRPEETFSQTVKRVSSSMDQIKVEHPWLPMTTLLEVYNQLGFTTFLKWITKKESRLTAPILSNIGLIAPSPLCFGATTVTDAYMIGPALVPPGLLLAATTYQNCLTLAMAFYEPASSRQEITEFLQAIRRELTLI